MPYQKSGYQSMLPYHPVINEITYPKITPMQENPQESELEQFRQEMIEQRACPHHHPYETHKRNALFYRSIFFGFGILFLGLMWFIAMQQTNWFCNAYMGYCLLTKMSASGFCGLAAIAALSIGLRIRADREAVQNLLSKAKRHIGRMYARKRTSFGVKRFLVFCQHNTQAILMRHAYHESVDKMHEIKDTTLQLLDQISKASHLDHAKKIELLNMAILDMREKLHQIVKSFH